MERYVPGTEGDAPLLKWYFTLVQEGSLQKLAGQSVYAVGAFMRLFAGPDVRIFYLEDDKGWWIASWMVPFMGGINWGFWIREDRRHTPRRDALDFLMQTQALGFAAVPVLLTCTKQEEVADVMKRLGYTVHGPIPKLFDGEDCWLSYRTREEFEPDMARWEAYQNGRSTK